MARFLLTAVVLSLTACVASIKTGEPLADTVVALEAENSPCVALRGPTLIFAEDDGGPPGMLTAKSIKDEHARIAARKLERKWQDAPMPTIENFGIQIGDRCPMQVNRPAFSGGFAFVGFSNPGGRIGTYVFQRVAGEWQVAERVVSGFW